MSSANQPPSQDPPALEFLRSARDLRGLSEMQIDRLERRLRPPRPRRLRFLRPAFLVSLAIFLLAGVAVASGIVRVPGLSRWFAPTPDKPSGVVARPTPAQRRQASATPVPLPSVSPVSDPVNEPLVLPPPSLPSGTPGPGPVRRSRPVLETSTNPTAHLPAELPSPPAPMVAQAIIPKPALPESSLLAEGRSFSEALSRWHRDRNAPSALATLDAHDRRFGDGQMRLEARLLRAEIVLSLGRDREALAILDAVPLAGLPRERELRTVRGELRIKHGRCAEGRGDLSVVTASDPLDAFGQRAARAATLCP